MVTRPSQGEPGELGAAAAAMAAAPGGAAAGGSAAGAPPAAGAKGEWVRPCAGVFGADYDLADVNVVAGAPAPAGSLRDLDEIPASAWTQVQEPVDGYHYLCHSYVAGRAVETMIRYLGLGWEVASCARGYARLRAELLL